MKLKKQDIEHIAKLARLELSSKELKKYGGQLSAILGYIGQLQEADTTGVEPTAQITGLENVFREAETKEWDEQEREDALAQAPEIEDGQIKVKRILD